LQQALQRCVLLLGCVPCRRQTQPLLLLLLLLLLHLHSMPLQQRAAAVAAAARGAAWLPRRCRSASRWSTACHRHGPCRQRQPLQQLVAPLLQRSQLLLQLLLLLHQGLWGWGSTRMVQQQHGVAGASRCSG
jgi:hypothetical protein